MTGVQTCALPILDRALELAQIAHQQIPEDPQIGDTLGWIYVQKNLPQVGVPYLEASASKLPRDGDVHFHLGTAYMQNGEPARARTALTKALALGLRPDDETAARTLLNTLDSAQG